MDDRRFYPDLPPFPAESTFRPNGSIRFEPLLFQQRYSFVVNILGNSYWSERIKTVADFGCSELNFFRILKTLRFLEKVYLSAKMENFSFDDVMPPPNPLMMDSQILAYTIESVDAVAKKLHEEQRQNARLKDLLGRLVKTARKFERNFSTEKKKTFQLEEQLRTVRNEKRVFEQQVEAKENEIINMNILHEQTLAQAMLCSDVETKENQKFLLQLFREYLNSVRTLENHELLDNNAVTKVYSLRRGAEKFSWMRCALTEFSVPEKKTPPKRRRGKRRNKTPAASSCDEDDSFELDGTRIEEQLRALSPPDSPEVDFLGFSDSDESPQKNHEKEEEILPIVVPPPRIMVDAATMTTRVTVTRATNTENPKKETVSVGTVFPEITYPTLDEIFREMIIDLPDLIDDLPPTPCPVATTQTDDAAKVSIDVETMTDLCNVSKSIGYRKKKTSQQACVKMENLKSEPQSPLSDANSTLQLQFDRLWSTLGHILYVVLQNVPTEGRHSDELMEQEETVLKIYQEMAGMANGNNFVQRYIPTWLNSMKEGREDLVEVSIAEKEGEEHPVVPERRLSVRIEEKSRGIQENLKRKSPEKEQESLKKIKLQRLPELPESPKSPEPPESSEDEFNLEEIREFYTLPDLVDNLEELPEITPETHHPEEQAERLLSIMDFIECRSDKDMKNWQPDGGILRKCRETISGYLQADWSSEELQKHVQQIQRPDEQNLFEAIGGIIEESTDELMFNPFGSLAPLMPRTHQQIFIFCHTLAQDYPPGFLRRLRHSIERRMFTLSGDKKNVKSLVNLTYLIIALMDLQFEENFGKLPIRLFMFKCLYYFHHKATPLIYRILKAFPDCLPLAPLATECDWSEVEPLLLAIQCSLMNLPPMSAITEAPEYKKKELLHLLRMKYKYEPGGLSPETATEILMQRLRQGHSHNVPYALTLMAKRFEVVWAKKTLLQQHLIPALNTLLHQESTDLRNSQIISLTTTISCIVKSFPSKEDMGEYYRIFGCILETMTDHPVVQEAAVAAFIRLSRFGMVNVFSQIYQWRASTTISRQLAASLDTLAHRKSQKYWRTLEKQI
ncbi:hypothetical protein DMENIID0001_150160 [Sergentomyia squamirostris]